MPLPPSEQAHLRVTHASSDKQRDPAGRSLVKRYKESEPALIIVIFSFLLHLSELKCHHVVEKREKRKNCQSIVLDEERFDRSP